MKAQKPKRLINYLINYLIKKGEKKKNEWFTKYKESDKAKNNNFIFFL